MEKTPINQTATEDDDSIEASDTPSTSSSPLPPLTLPLTPPIKQKKPRPPKTQKQLETVAVMQEAKRKAVIERRMKREAEEAEHKRIIEEKILQKALAIKKRQIKKEKMIEDAVSDDDTPLEEIQKIARARPKIVRETVYVEPPQPRFRFI